jgi:cytochrome c oxidase cbb3-type subunit II
MKNGALFLLGVLAALAFPWFALVLGANTQLGALAPYYDAGEAAAFPKRPSGLAAQGEQVYRDLACAACHTQQVRRPGFGSDQARGWGDRQSVARDYLFRDSVQLGTSRLGPDLANLAGRKPTAPDASDLLKLLYTGQGNMPAHRYLFENQPILGERSDRALILTGELRPPAGRQIVPTRQAEALVAYLLSLNTSYEYPEARPAAPTEGEKR